MIQTLKLLIDTLFVILCLGFFGFLFILPFEIFNTKIVEVEFNNYGGFQNLPFLYWTAIGLSIATYTFFLIGLNYLRKTANRFISSVFYSIEIIRNLKLSGIFFLLSAVVLAFTYIVAWGIDVSEGHIKLVLGTNVMIPMFLCIVGLFFILQSKVLNQARLFKEDSDLTI